MCDPDGWIGSTLISATANTSERGGIISQPTRSVSLIFSDRYDANLTQPDRLTLRRKPPKIQRFEKIGAGEGIRTLDPDLGKVVLYP
jgi:hypothetical protein